jgi:NAD(P)H dehydrogenase (quinone)
LIASSGRLVSVNEAETKVAIVFHSERGHTRALAEAVERGASSTGVSVMAMSVDAIDWAALASADAIVFGCPTFMGSASASFKAFMDASSRKAWASRAWKDKLAAGFTVSSAASGDKLSTLTQLAVFAAQHDMIWVGLGLPPGKTTRFGSDEDLNRLGGHLGAMAQAFIDADAAEAPPESDRRTAEHLGVRVARAAIRWRTGTVVHDAPSGRHPTTKHWRFPPERPPLEPPFLRVNLRELAARPHRFEHHLMVVARFGCAQLEIATASEPLPFAHNNISDEYAIAMTTGDPTLDAIPFLTLFSDPTSALDVGRIKHRASDLVMHPVSHLHWPGRLRPPFEPFAFGPGERRTGYTLVYCASRPTESHPARPAFVSAGRAGDVKSYSETAFPFLLADTRTEDARMLGAIAETVMILDHGHETEIGPSNGAYLVVLESAGAWFAGDLVYIPAGAKLPSHDLGRALLFMSQSEPVEPPPRSWTETPEAPFAPFEEGPPGALPLSIGALSFDAISSALVRVSLDDSSVEVPRYWLARMLFRVALHRYTLGYVETYGGFFHDDRHGSTRLGLRGAGSIELDPREREAAVEALYRAVAPPGYVERVA